MESVRRASNKFVDFKTSYTNHSVQNIRTYFEFFYVDRNYNERNKLLKTNVTEYPHLPEPRGGLMLFQYDCLLNLILQWFLDLVVQYFY